MAYEEPSIDGYLKQQCLDTSGLYEWVKKRFRLDINSGALEIFVTDADDYNQSSLSLSGAKYAKEWSVSSAIAGFGFDIVWTSGKIWSFLADDELTCQSWVKGINKSIAVCIHNLDKAVSESVAKSQDDLRALLRMPPAATPASKINNKQSFIPQQQQQQQQYDQSGYSQNQQGYRQQYTGAGTMAYPIQIYHDDSRAVQLQEGTQGVFTQKQKQGPGDFNNPQYNITVDPTLNKSLYFPGGKAVKGADSSGHSSDSNSQGSHDTATEFQSPISLHGQGYGQQFDPRYYPSGVQHTVPRYPDGSYRPPQDQQHISMGGGHHFGGGSGSGLGLGVNLSVSAIAAAEGSSNDSSPQSSEESKQEALRPGNPDVRASRSGVAGASLQPMFAMEGGSAAATAAQYHPDGSINGPAAAGYPYSSSEQQYNASLPPDAPSLNSPTTTSRRGGGSLTGGVASPKRHTSTASFAAYENNNNNNNTGTGAPRDRDYEYTSYSDPNYGGSGGIPGGNGNNGNNGNSTNSGSPRAATAAAGGGGVGVSVNLNAMQSKILEQVMEIEALKLRCKQLGADAEREKSDTEAVRKSLSLIQQERDDAVAQVTQMTVSLKEKERLAVQAAQNELHTLVARASNESDALHEASLRAVKEQHYREMSCLRDELAAERKRYGEATSRETKLRDELEAREFDLRRENANLRDQNVRFSAEISRLQDAIKADSAAWQREKDAVVAAADARVASLQDERDKLVARAQTDQRLKISELTQRFDVSVQDMELQIRDTVRQEMISDKLQEMTILQKRCSNDVEAARQDERKLGQAALDDLRRTYAERERQTTEDLAQLEKLHAGRVARLENQITVLKARADAAEERMNDTVLELNRVTGETQRTNEKHLQQLEEHAQRADALTTDLSGAHSEVQESRAREMSYREQLTRVLEEARVRHAELVELQRQVTDRSAQASTWRKAASEIDVTQANASTQLQIAAEEIAMLEHELNRVKQENSSLRKSLGSADRLVYGVFGHTSTSNSGGGGIRGEQQQQYVYGSSSATDNDDFVDMAKRAGGGTRGRSDARADSTTRSRSSSATRRASFTKAGLIKQPPWRNGTCNCNCKASKCKCGGNGAPITTITSSSRPNSPGRNTTLASSSTAAAATHKHSHTHHHTHTHLTPPPPTTASRSESSSPYPSVRYSLPRSARSDFR